MLYGGLADGFGNSGKATVCVQIGVITSRHTAQFDLRAHTVIRTPPKPVHTPSSARRLKPGPLQ
jgi:hypothetical protein